MLPGNRGGATIVRWTESQGCDLYLRSLKLVGFKSFADRTRLQLEPGVSVVVGPNGTGKSNIVDAVAWVLGSQFTRALRTDRMDDVIFAGTATRASHSRAEVTVVMDNTDRLLPLDLDEVSLTRRLFRGGLSEYEINGVQCRLLDVQELLSDSGVGRHQHLIVGQGRLDSLLTTNGDHRRRIIEEAAGILKHQVRKVRAIRRLEETDRDVVRLHDVVGEIERRRRPLRRQVLAAERYELVQNELRSLRLWIGGENLRTSRSRLKELAEGRARWIRDVEGGRSDLRELEQTLAALESERTATLVALDLTTAVEARLDTVGARLRGISHVARERVGGLSIRIEAAGERHRKLEDEARRLTERLIESTQEEERARQTVRSAQGALDVLADRLRSLPDREPRPAEADLPAMRLELRSLEATARQDAGERSNLELLIEEGRSRMVEDAESLEALEDELRDTGERLEAARRVVDARTAARSELEAAWGRSDRTLRSATAERLGAQARVQALEEMQSGFGRADGKGLEDWDGVRGVLAKILEVPDRFVPAVEAALGTWTEGVVLERVGAMRSAFARLRSEGRGGLPLLHCDASAGKSLSAEVVRTAGVDALVDVLGRDADRNLASFLLGDVVLVEAWQTGLRVVRSNPEVRAVTREGDLITSFGICPANPEQASPGLLEAARRELKAAGTVEAEAVRAESESSVLLAEARSAEEATRAELASLRSDRARLKADMDRTHRARASAMQDLAALTKRLDTVRGRAAEREQRLRDLTQKVKSLEDGLEEHRESRELLLSQRASVELEHKAAGLARDDAMRSFGAATERRRFLDTRLRSVRADLEQLDDVVAESRELSDARSVRRLTRRVIDVVESKAAELAVLREALKEKVSAADRGISQTRRELSGLARAIEAGRSRLNEIAVEETEVRIREESLLEALRRDADASEEEAMVAERPAGAGGDTGARVASLAAELARLGPVNLLANEEFRELDERYQLISGQVTDLERSRAELGKVIAALDDEMETRFSRTFELAARHYRRFFSALFPGGTGCLTLTDPAAPLESGVEIEAQPLGKKVGKLALLSGGERSLAALAFLFAVFKARPGPFYILDEVDAALDDANLQRFLRLVDEFRDHAQLIVVTHQQATVRAADVLFGVTMEPGGSSQALVRKMDEVPALV